MSEKKLVCKGAIVECEFGDFPDTLLVLTQKKNYINDQAGNQKLIATDKELGVPFQTKTFGQCKLQPMGSSFKPCMPAITSWQGAFEKTQLKENKGYPLLEDSKATCVIAGSPCVKINFHGQVAEPSAQNVKNADEDITAQLLPQINPKKMKDISPYEGLAIALDETEFIQTRRDISVEITTLKVTFVPLGIPDFHGNIENEYLKFNINISENPAEKMAVIVFKNGKTHYKEEITNKSMFSVGSHEWTWDGFGTNGEYDSKSFKEDNYNVEVTVWLDGQQKSNKTTFEKAKPVSKDWLDIVINKNKKRIDIELRVNLIDGGANGLKCSTKNIGYDPKYRIEATVCPWDKISKEALKNEGKPHLETRTKSFEDLKQLAIKGVNTYWSRNANNIGKNVDIGGEKYEVFVKAVNTTVAEKSLDDIPLIFNTNKPWSRSGNTGGTYDDGNWDDEVMSALPNGLVQRISYNVGYIYHSNWKEWYSTHPIHKNKGWVFKKEKDEVEDFKETSAHEIGHELLQAFGGTVYSWQHKGSSYYLPQDTKPVGEKSFKQKYINLDYMKETSGENTPANGEIDLMKYYNDYSDYKERKVASQEDVLGLIWLTKLNLK